ncbi:MAG: methylmalonyl Co-A mutase-associated GTPase MeaB [Polyangiaceae bacterium]|nr:methylmalonyl Co-A mutase-associated GTPase MeaB [Polyangiaceae bacterium]MCE7891734.1 methylmalonyl Co-A mutase-associated GTPase MeaB [Sorangiineae bacterium PRO1]MCL4753536.1 methylmalonyl Co-A mutase-associated GTPase MeaB [Myxococcales bacterium]
MASDLPSRILAGDPRAAARACRAVDDRLEGHRELMKALYPKTGDAWLIGVTGTPGAGKSTLTDQLITQFRGAGERVAVVAVDPTSPFSGGAILGDRIRMQRHFEDPEVFIRSVATRGALGGLSRSTSDISRILDAWGARVVIVETVGVGQDELEVTRMAHTTLVVMAPGMGDDVQAIKAGILECADVFAVNKADRDGADATVRDLEVMLALSGDIYSVAAGKGRGHSAVTVGGRAAQGASGDAWTPPIVKTAATRGTGIPELAAKLREHRVWLDGEAGKLRRAERLHLSMLAFLREALTEEATRELGAEVERAAERVQRKETDPYTASEELIAEFRARG